MDDFIYDMSVWAGLLTAVYPLIKDIAQQYAMRSAVNLNEVVNLDQSILNDPEETILAFVQGCIVPMAYKFLPRCLQFALLNQRVYSHIEQDPNTQFMKYTSFALRTSTDLLVYVDNVYDATFYPSDILHDVGVGDVITAIGRVYRSSDKSLHLGPSHALQQYHWPFIISSLSKQQIMRSAYDGLTFALNAASAVMFGILAFNRLHQYIKWTRNSLYILGLRLRTYFHKFNVTKVGSISDMNCIECSNNVRDVISFPCRHLVLCLSCSDNLKYCPWCEQEVDYFIKIFPA